ncbi:MAG: flagellar basal body-associated FliL family protein [Pseudomonadota bacterium]
MAEAIELTDPGTNQGTGKWWIIGIIIFLIVVASVIGALYAFGVFGKPGQTNRTTDRQEALYLSVEPPFTVNFSGGGHVRYLQVGMDIMTRDPEVKDALVKHMPVIRNDLVLLLSSKTADELGTLEGKEELQQETLSVVRRVIEDESDLTGVEAVYFTSFVMQ